MNADQLRRAVARGTTTGKNAASWVFDGNATDETYRTFLTLRENGDPADEQFAPRSGWLSGEMADDPTPNSLAAEIGIREPEDIDEACSAFEEAADDAYWAELERVARIQVGA